MAAQCHAGAGIPVDVLKDLMYRKSVDTTMGPTTPGSCIRWAYFRRSPAERATVVLLRHRLDTLLAGVA
jgi:hypothetical protein